MGLPDEKPLARTTTSMPSVNGSDGVAPTNIPEEKPRAEERLNEGSSKDTEDTSSHDRDGELNLERSRTAHDEPPEQSQVERTVTTASNVGPMHSVFSTNQKRFIVVMASWAGFFSPVSANIYFPALNSLARDLGVTSTLINLTLTSYMIFQGLAPSVIGNLADSAGRRPAYAACFVVYVVANIGLALQNNYAALFVLRCVQSSGSSGTIALSSGVVSDIATVSERGKYLGFITAVSLLGPSIGPVIGGVLAQFLGWRAIFWFLTIMAVAFLIPFAIFFPETARTVVGNGSVSPVGWSMSLLNYLALRRARHRPDYDPNDLSPKPKRKPFNPLASVQLLGDKETAILLLYNAVLFAGFYDITASLPSLFDEIYGFNDLQIGLCYLPFGVGCCCAALSNGQLLDRNFHRWARRLGLEIKKGRQTDLQNFPIEKVRLQIAFPMLYIASAMMLIYGWVLDVNGPLAAVLVLLFIMSFCMTAAFNVISTLLIDFYPKAPATATAANNLLRCLLGAGATAAITPMINAMGRGWCFTFLTLFLVATSPLLWWIYFKGMDMREERRVKTERKESEAEAKSAAKEEEGRARTVEVQSEKTTASEARGGDVELLAVAEEEREKGEEGSGEEDQPGRHKLARVFSHESAYGG